MARGRHGSKGLEVDALEVVPVKDEEAVTKAVSRLGGFAHGQYVQAHCNVYPTTRSFHRHKMPSAKTAENGAYFTKVATEDYQMDPKVYRVALGTPETGSAIKVGKDSASHVLFLGAREQELRSEQERLLGYGVYPLSLQLGTMGTISGLLDYCEQTECDQPLLFIEIGFKNTHLFVLHKGVHFSRHIHLGLESMYPQLMEELGFEDSELVQNLIFSNTFDFSEVGPRLLKDILKEVQSCVTYYEAKRGQSISFLFMSLLPESLQWAPSVLSQSLGIKPLDIHYSNWLSASKITFADKVNVGKINDTMMGLLGLMCTVSYA